MNVARAVAGLRLDGWSAGRFRNRLASAIVEAGSAIGHRGAPPRPGPRHQLYRAGPEAFGLQRQAWLATSWDWASFHQIVAGDCFGRRFGGAEAAEGFVAQFIGSKRNMRAVPIERDTAQCHEETK